MVRGLTRNSVQFHAVNVTYPNKLSLIRANIKHARLLYKQRISNSSMTSSFGQTHTHRGKWKLTPSQRKNHHPLCIFNGRHVLFICMRPLWMIGHSGAGWVSFLITSKYVFNANFQIKADKLPERERGKEGEREGERQSFIPSKRREQKEALQHCATRFALNSGGDNKALLCRRKIGGERERAGERERVCVGEQV